MNGKRGSGVTVHNDFSSSTLSLYYTFFSTQSSLDCQEAQREFTKGEEVKSRFSDGSHRRKTSRDRSGAVTVVKV